MKYIALCALLLVAIVGRGQAKGDTTKPYLYTATDLSLPFLDIVFLMQQNKELSDRLDRAEKRIDSLERRPYIFIDNKGVRPGLWLTNFASEYQIFVGPIK